MSLNFCDTPSIVVIYLMNCFWLHGFCYSGKWDLAFFGMIFAYTLNFAFYDLNGFTVLMLKFTLGFFYNEILLLHASILQNQLKSQLR